MSDPSADRGPVLGDVVFNADADLSHTVRPEVTDGGLAAINGDRHAMFPRTGRRDYGRFRLDNLIFDAIVRIANRPRLLTAALVGVLAGSGAAYAVLEGTSFMSGAWWAIVTGFTVGYGDMYPTTVAGRGLGAFLIVSMFVLALCLGAQITSRLIEDQDEFSHAEQEEIKSLLWHMHSEQNRMCALNDRMLSELGRLQRLDGHVVAKLDLTLAALDSLEGRLPDPIGQPQPPST